MKKLVYLLIAVSLTLALVPAAGFAHTADAPFVTDLMAGQHIDAGDVSVWNDDSNLFVKYETTGDWCLAETHLHVATSLDDIPQKNGNPIPGQFEYKSEHDCVTEYTYTINYVEKGWTCDTQLYIAAHAVVIERIGEGCTSPQWATMVLENGQGTLVGGGSITDPARTVPGAALGAPDASTSPPATGFYSLGFVSDSDGYLVLGFDYPVYNGPGEDIKVYEVTWGRSGYPREAADVYVIADGVEYYAGTVANHDDGGVGAVSIPEGLLYVDAVKLVDATDPNLFGSRPTADGYDVDAVGACYLFAGEETAWGFGPGFLGKNWATYFPYTIQCAGAPPEGCETAFAYGGEYATCFTDIIDTPRWGWSNGALISGSYAFDIYAGAGQCDINKGTLVGTLTVDYDGSTATVTYTMYDGYTMDETHLYVGSEVLPRDVNGEFTAAPGQYPYSHDLTEATSDTYTVVGLSGDIYVVAHAVVCGFTQ